MKNIFKVVKSIDFLHAEIIITAFVLGYLFRMIVTM